MEHIRTTKVEQVKLLDRFSLNSKSTAGSLHLTATHLLFIDSVQQRETWILHHHIAAVEKLALTTTGCPLVIQSKNFRVLHFIVPRERDCHDIYNSLLQLSRPAQYSDLYAFSYNPKQNELERLQGWQLINLSEEYQRMGVPNSNWQLSDANRDYKAAICRCSQPLSGFSARCLEDENMLQAISKANPINRYMYVMDTRPKLNAMANRAAGKGYENEDNYSNIRFQFVGIENIHVMRSSLHKVLEVSGTKGLGVNEFLSGLEGSGWLRHIKAVLDAAICLAKAIAFENASVLVHCSDGWDRTSQVCSLGSLLLDPYYRTIKGFMVLIEKDWISLGHKFSERCGQLDGDPKEMSPVFLQFLECVWHLTEQYPRAFEYTEVFLLQIHEHVHSCQFGNFLGNCQKEREDLMLKEKTYSLWPYLLSNQEKYLNPLYDSDNSQKLTILEPFTLPFNFKFWRRMFHQFDNSMHPRQSVSDHILKLSHENRMLEENIGALEEKLKKQKNRLSDERHDCMKDPLRSSHPVSATIRTSECFCKDQVLLQENGGTRTIEDSNLSDNRYTEYSGEFSKAEPAVVSLEYGVARMTC
ncbi:phosphatidylinositol-3,5-bisphosphate 3-phosphatase MTMR6 isoform X1 [Ambystoma mexicanum]|uniref:phosphatidylinositol-3,5-bisphosphate 3-phosphatase MTMR6 isoform X1 n=1 Tax=Ambystoma mexicanum TaxID=8296 RepID=UPI0037E8E2A1